MNTFGWKSDFPTFHKAEPRVVQLSLSDFVKDASQQQIRAWDDSIPLLQREAGELLEQDQAAVTYTAILEYMLPMEARRTDAIVLLAGPVVVIELKGKRAPSQADLDQASAYARDLRCYHRECEKRPVHAVLVPTRAGAEVVHRDNVFIVGPEGLDGLLKDLSNRFRGEAASPEAFISHEAYRPLPTLVQAARELLESREIREIWKARAATDPAVQLIAEIAHEAAAKKTRHLVLLSGVPGSGKTLVGLRAVHARYLDDLAVDRGDGKPTVPAVFLSGNGPLVEVLQYALQDAGGGGRTFVRGVKDYLERYVPNPAKCPPEHLLVFDEAQRAFSREMVQDKHSNWPAGMARDEPEHFIQICDRIPAWSVLVGLIGTGQEIHKGEEEGLAQWRCALEASKNPEAWTVHAPAALEEVFSGSRISSEWDPRLNLNTELRFHLVSDLHEFVAGLLGGKPAAENARIARKIWGQEPEGPAGLRLWITRDLSTAKEYLRERYADHPDARFGLVASSKDKVLEKQFGVPNSYMATKNMRLGPWYKEGDSGTNSCRRLEKAVTEFGAQGLELDMPLLAWGTDFIRLGGRWSDAKAAGYRGKVRVKDPFQLRVNAYRVLLTRGRDGTVIFMPPLDDLNETFEYLIASGFRLLPA